MWQADEGIGSTFSYLCLPPVRSIPVKHWVAYKPRQSEKLLREREKKKKKLFSFFQFKIQFKIQGVKQRSTKKKRSVQTLSLLLPAPRSYCRDQSSSTLTVQRERSYKVGQNESLHPLKAATSYCSRAKCCSLDTSCSRLAGAHQTAFHVWSPYAFPHGLLAGEAASSSGVASRFK